MNLRTWQSLAEPAHEELIRLASETNARDVAAVDRLRKLTPDRELIHAALQLAEARRKGMPKFGKRAATLWADPEGVEMASSAMVAAHKTRHIRGLCADAPVLDLCCGIGGDAMALNASGLGVTAVDLDPVRAWMAGVNARCATLTADAAAVEIPPGPVHIDPARRDAAGGARLWRLDDLRPGLDVLRRVVAHAEHGAAIKLGPGADLGAIGSAFPGSRIEIVSEGGRLVQAVVWLGALANHGSPRIATLLRSALDGGISADGAVTIVGDADRGDLPSAPEHRPARFIFEIDDAVERAGLLGALCEQVGAPMLHPRLGLLTADALIDSPWLTPFEVVAEMPWNLRRVREALTDRCAGIVEVKTRGGAVDPDLMQMDLRGCGAARLTVFVLRFDRVLRAIIARRVNQRDGATA